MKCITILYIKVIEMTFRYVALTLGVISNIGPSSFFKYTKGNELHFGIYTYFMIGRQETHALRNNQAQSCNHCYSGRTIRITYSDCISVALGIEEAILKRHVVFCGVSGCTVFLLIMAHTAIY